MFEGIPRPNLNASSPDYDATRTGQHPDFDYEGLSFPTHTLKRDHTQFGANEMAPLQWSGPPDVLAKVKEWVVFIEDPDAPLPNSNPHAIFYCIPPDVHAIDNASIAPGSLPTSRPVPESSKACLGGFYAGLNGRRIIYIGPRPPMGHGLHRYFHQVIGLGQTVDWKKICEGKEGVGPAELADGCKDHVVAWGCRIAGVGWRWPGKLVSEE